jgi:hypothetical protein
MSEIWESANWTRQFGIRQTGNQQFGMLPLKHPKSNPVIMPCEWFTKKICSNDYLVGTDISQEKKKMKN